MSNQLRKNDMPLELQDLFEMEQQDKIGSMIRTTEQKVCSHQIFLDEDIGAPSKYRDLINLLYMANEDDQVNIFVNSSGGFLSSAMAIIEAIKGSSAKVRAIITGECHSAASIIALHCHEILVTDSAHMMIHTANYGAGGNTHVVKKHVDFSTSHINKIIHQTYDGFLTPEELVEVNKGVEMWFDSSQIKHRLDLKYKYLTAKAEAKKKPKKKSEPAQDTPV